MRPLNGATSRRLTDRFWGTTGDLNAIRHRIREHHSAGADHVCIQVLTADRHALPLREWREPRGRCGLK